MMMIMMMMMMMMAVRLTLQEETEVAEQFARLIASNQLSLDDVNQILGNHARSVHLLRMRQGDERQRLLDRLDAKRQARRTAAAAGDHDEQQYDDGYELGKASNDAPKIASSFGSVSILGVQRT